MQAPIRFTSAVPGAIAQRQGDQQALQQFFDRNKVEKARMEQIKSLKQLAKGYGASAAQVESSSYGELQGFVQRMELERADKTREEQTRLRELQMAQAQQATRLAAEQASREDKLRKDQRSLFQGLLTSPGEQLTPEGMALTRELEGYEQAAPTFIDSMRAVGMSPEQLAKIEQGQADQIESFRQRLAGPSMRSPLPSSAEQMFPGRPQVQRFLRSAVEEGQNPELAFGMAAKMAAALPSREAGLLYGRGGPAGTGQQQYYFSESEANNAYNQMAASQGITPTKEGREAWTGQSKIISLKDLRADADRQIRNADLGAGRDILKAYRDIGELMESRNPIGDTAIQEKLARMLQPVGILTDSDIMRYGGSAALVDQINKMLEKLDTGMITDADLDFIKTTSKGLALRAAQDLSEGAEGIALDLRDSYGISEADVWAKTPLDELARLIPPGLLPAPGGAAPTVPTPTTGRTTIPGTNATFKRN
jgi:hypothetical protein